VADSAEELRLVGAIVQEWKAEDTLKRTQVAANARAWAHHAARDGYLPALDFSKSMRHNTVMAKKLDKTLADYVVGGVMPALLIGLLVSLSYFLLELAVSGQNVGQLKWVLFFFIVGTVLIARIAMNGEIAERAGVYGIALAIAAGLALVRFVEIPQTALGGLGWLIPISLMSIIWWSAHKLTLDSTWDEDTEPGETGGLFDDVPDEKPDREGKKKDDWFDQYQADRQEEQRRKKPGLTIVYFSLAALPLFGLGQALLPAHDVAGRRYAFWLLTMYVACGLGLLLTTSFLSLRRYLRGRRLQMPAAMTGLWLGLGTALILALMVLSATFLPRPEAEYHLSQLLQWASSKERDANRTHFFEGSHGKNDNSGKQSGAPEKQNAGNQQPRDGEQGQKAAQNGRGNPSGQKQSGDQRGQPGRRNDGGNDQGNSQQGQQGQGKQGQGQQGNNGKGNNQKGSGKQDGSSGGNQKSGEKQPGKGGQQDPQGKGGGQTRDKDGEGGNQDRGEGGNRENQKENNKQTAPEKGDQRQPDEEREGNRQGESKQEQEEGSGQAPPPPRQEPPQASSMSWDWLNWLVWALIIIGVVYALWKWGKQLWTALVQIWREILAWWRGLFGLGEEEQRDAELVDPESSRPPQPFAWFTNPLLTPGRFKTMEEMIRYSFAALHSWAYEQNQGRQPDETPTEFAVRLGQLRQRAHQDIRKLADLYAVVTYARAKPPAASEAILRSFWNRLAEEPPPRPVVN
jgi:hypothetical protein